MQHLALAHIPNRYYLAHRMVQMCTLPEANNALEFEQSVNTQAYYDHVQAFIEAVELAESDKLVNLYHLLKWHKYLFAFGGHFRNCNAFASGSGHSYVDYRAIGYAMNEFIADLTHDLETRRDSWYMLAEYHLKFVNIHPFMDGNGRIARILLNYMSTYFSLPLIKICDRDQYIRLLESEDITGLVRLFKRSTI